MDPATKKSFAHKILVWILGVAAIWLIIFISPPRHFPSGVVVNIEAGASVIEAARYLTRARAIRSPLLFRLAALTLSPRRGVLAGGYIFERPLNLWQVAARVTSGFLSKELTRVTLPEGLSNEEMAQILAANLRDFEAEKFVTLAEPFVGELFPDTYFFPPTASEAPVLAALRSNFAARLAPLEASILSSGYTLNEILTMASLVEKEASHSADRRLVAGVLWKRLEEGMLLQVDAVFPYIVGRNTYEVTLEDLEVDSPYNTYKYVGLPPAPIVNPSLSAIEAVLNPETTDYLFYLTGNDGHFYFAENFDDHKSNRTLYLQ